MNSNRGIFIRLAMATRVNLKAYLCENISRYIEYRSTDIRSVSRKGKAREGIFRNEWTVKWERRFYQNTRISARSLDIVAAGNAFLAFVARLASRFNFREKNKALPRRIFFAIPRRVTFATGNSCERAKLLGEPRIDRARSTGVC